MKEIMKYLKWSVVCQPIGIVCAFIAYFIPSDPDSFFKSYLFVFGMAVTLGYWLYVLVKVYLPLKKENE